MQKLLIRTGIVLFAAFALAIFFSPFITDRGPEAEVLASARTFEEEPNERNLRRLLGMYRDGASSYLHMAQVGRLFAAHPELFREVAGKIETERERDALERLAKLCAGVFEYHPELKPGGFEDRLRDAAWLVEFR